jgi:hypothetical protein
MITRYTDGMVQYTNLCQLQEQEQQTFTKFTGQLLYCNSLIVINGTNIGIRTSTPNSLAFKLIFIYIYKTSNTNGAGKIWGIGVDNYNNGINFSEVGVADGRLFFTSRW